MWNGTVANSMKSCALAVDGTEDGWFPALKKEKYVKQEERYLKFKYDNKLKKDSFDISPENMVDAAPLFNIIDEEEDDIDIEVWLLSLLLKKC